MNDATRQTIAPLAKANAALRGGRHGALAKLAFGSVSVHATRTLSTGGIDPGRHLAFLPADTLELDLSDPAQRRFGDYELLEAIGEGGMGVVYRARQISLDREVAVKLLSAGPWASRDFVERFQREAQNAARMQHPNIVAIHEVGAIEGLHFFSMRLIRGSSLAQLIRDGSKLTPSRAAALLRTIAEAVDYAHRLGVLHLDLKPGNVLLDERGEPHVADFGLARRLDQALAADNDEISGTPSYMAPEQATRGAQRITTATDVWGLGAIGYELVTGEPPFRGDTAKATLKLVLDGTLRSPRRYVPELPRDLEAVILKCLSREPGQRYPTARALADDLQRFVEGRPVRARPLNFFQRIGRAARREPKLAAMVILALGALLIGLAATTQQWRRANANAGLANDRLWQTRTDQASAAIRDGHLYDALPGLAANVKEREAQGLDASEDRLRYATTVRTAPRLIDVFSMGANVWGVGVAPDGASIAVALGDERIRLIDAANGTLRWETSVKGATHMWLGRPTKLVGLRFTPDGHYVIGSNYESAEVLVSPFGEEVMVDAKSGRLMVPPASRAPDFSMITFSADGTHALVQGKEHRVQLLRTSDWEPASPVITFDNAIASWLLSTSARQIASCSNGLLTISLHDSATLAVRHSQTYKQSQQITSWAFSPDGSALVVGHLDGQIHHIDTATGKSDLVAPGLVARVGTIEFSADGMWFGAVADSGDVMVWDSASLALEAPAMRLVQHSGYHRDQLRIDAATRTVLAASDVEMALWRIGSAHVDAQRLSAQFVHASPDKFRALSYDAARGLVVTGGLEGELRQWRVPPTAMLPGHAAPLPEPELLAPSGRIVQVRGDAVQPISTRDGAPAGARVVLPQAPTFVALTADAERLVAVVGPKLFVYNASSGTSVHAPIELPNDPVRVVLHPDSRHAVLVYSGYTNGEYEETIEVRDFESGATVAQSVVTGRFIEGFNLSPDGSLLAVSRDDDEFTLFDAITLHTRWQTHFARGGFLTDETEIQSLRFSPDSSRIYALTDDSVGANRLIEFDGGTGAILHNFALSGAADANSFMLAPDRSIVMQSPESGPLLWDADHGVTRMPGYGPIESRALALSADTRMFARATVDGAVVASRVSRQWLTGQLSAPLDAGDYPIQFAFERAGAGLIGRTMLGRWLYWDMRRDSRPAQQLVDEAALLHPEVPVSKGGIAMPLTAEQQDALRGGDTGTPRQTDSQRAIPIPPRLPDLSPGMVDLTAYYNHPIALPEALVQDWIRFDFPGFVAGVHRFLDVDFDARGMICLAMAGQNMWPQGKGYPTRVDGIIPGLHRIAALNVLLTGGAKLQRNEPLPYAIVEFDYRDGDHERVPLIYQRDVMEYWSGFNKEAQKTRVAWGTRNFNSPEHLYRVQRLFAARVANPHPEREVATLAVESTDYAWSLPAFFAMTVDPLSTEGAPAADTSQPASAQE